MTGGLFGRKLLANTVSACLPSVGRDVGEHGTAQHSIHTARTSTEKVTVYGNLASIDT